MLNQIDLDSEILTISQLNHYVRNLLEDKFPLIWIEGEISNSVRPRSGHFYFSLKDEYAQVRCAMFRPQLQVSKFIPQDGVRVLARARVSIYEPRGDFQLIIEHLEETGHGALQRAFELLKNKLAQEGLFDSKYKKKIPVLPQQIGVITSPTGAAIRDVLTVLKRRFPVIPIIIYPTQVQGSQATQQIAEAIKQANQHQECDVLLLVRGGGSLEDLWSFNEEIVARAIFASTIPIISGVGHEIDTTIADFVADQRAATPSAAAEIASPNRADWEIQLNALSNRLTRHIHHHFASAASQILHLGKRLIHPGRRLEQQAQHLDMLEARLLNSMRHSLSHKTNRFSQQTVLLQQRTPLKSIARQQSHLNALSQRLNFANKQQINRVKNQMSELASQLETLSPLRTLKRGYAVLSHDHELIRYTYQVKNGDRIQAQLVDGILHCVVESEDG